MKTCLALLVMALAPLSQHCITKSCTAVGCANGARLDVPIAATADQLAKTTLTVCRNADCSSGSPIVARPCASCPPRVDLKLTGALNVYANLFPDGTNASYSLSLEFNAFTDAERDALKDGDVYTVRLVPTTGAPFVDLKKTATYAKSYPNGVACDGENGYCRSATLVGG